MELWEQVNSNPEELQEKYSSKEESQTFHVEPCTQGLSIRKETSSHAVQMNMENLE